MIVFLMLLAAQTAADDWNRPMEPFRLIGNIYYVGPQGLSSYLITTPEGHILIDSGFERTVPLIRESVRKMGFRFQDIKILLSSHAHSDHVAGHALVKEFSGARVMASQADAAVISAGGAGRPVPVDRILQDGDTVKLGGVTMTAHLTPGHTQGCTTWTMTVEESGRKHDVVFVGGYSINTGVRLVHNAGYPEIADDYARTFRVLKSLSCDVFLAQHGDMFGLEEKARKLRAGAKPNPFIDPDGYRKAVEAAERTYREQLRRERDEALVWPQFRGKNSAGVAAGAAPVRFGPNQNVVWKTAVPSGHSSPVIAGDRIFLTGEEGGSRSPMDSREKITTNGKLVTLCLDRRNGEILWKREAPRPRTERYQPTGSAASPSAASDGNNVYVFFGDFGLISYRFDGTERWRLPLGPFNNVNGHGSSPVVVDDKVILVCDQDTDSYLLAVEKDTGRVSWKTERPEVLRSYVTPAVYRPSNGPAELIVPGAFQLASYAVETGRKLWWVRGQSWQPKSVPLVEGDMIYAHSWESGGDAEQPTETLTFTEALAQWDSNHDGRISQEEFQDPRMKRGFINMDLDSDGFLDERDWNFLRARRSSRNSLVAVRGGGRGDITASHVAWSLQKFLPNVPSPLLYQGVLYLIKDSGVLTALDPASGKILKQGRLTGALDTYYASPVGAGGRVYTISQQGKATVLKAGGEWEILATIDLEEECFATPAVADGRMYVRTQGRLYCFGQ